MKTKTNEIANLATLLNRRKTLALLGGAGMLAVTGKLSEIDAEAATCVNVAGAQTEGPYWVEENLNRSDIRTDPTDGTIRPGVMLNLKVNVVNENGTTCVPLAGAKVDIWHCDSGGVYSDEAANNTSGKKFLRGYQVTDDNGAVNFITIYPGWYSGRTIHIHFRIRTYSGTTKLDEFVAQIFFDETINDAVMNLAPYSTRPNRDTRNANDSVLTGTRNGAIVYADVTQTATGYSATATIGVSMNTTAASPPVITQAGVVNGASFKDGIVAGSWVAIFGQNLASGTRALTAADLVGGNMPTGGIPTGGGMPTGGGGMPTGGGGMPTGGGGMPTSQSSSMPTSLGGVSVTVNNKPAFLYYVSPTQINALAPDDTATGAVSVAVTNSGGTSPAVSATLLTVAPAFFASNGNLAAVRPDGTVIDGATVAAKAGDVLELFGTGFGPTSPAVTSGVVFQGSAPLVNTATVTIGGVNAPVGYAGMVGAGLYQLNVTVPVLAAGTYPVVAIVNGVSSQTGVTLKIQ
jgi:uncharacterized protein (TIGR03437 family)